jgi:hypothetical protein
LSTYTDVFDVSIRSALISAGVARDLPWSKRAAAPVTIGAEALVPSALTNPSGL